MQKHEKLKAVAQWLSGRVLDGRPRGHGFEPYLYHCFVVLEQHTFILSPSLVLVQPRKTCPCLTERLLMGHKESNQTKTKKLKVEMIGITHFLCIDVYAA